ncbi:hypothetical protein N7456_010639 [Penicillium angulare]|uniref:Uncharacterized protein n=1 Tax=Penicillium angulare TaxID=116970 RepID=A0A9W9F704_9EURO|nr:hypothetical protein N7456_010639 [Penicillium angulare]
MAYLSLLRNTYQAIVLFFSQTFAKLQYNTTTSRKDITTDVPIPDSDPQRSIETDACQPSKPDTTCSSSTSPTPDEFSNILDIMVLNENFDFNFEPRPAPRKPFPIKLEITEEIIRWLETNYPPERPRGSRSRGSTRAVL